MASQPNFKIGNATKLPCQKNGRNQRLIRTQSLPATKVSSTVAAKPVSNVGNFSQQSEDSEEDSVLNNAFTESPPQSQNSTNADKDPDDSFEDLPSFSFGESQNSENSSQQSQQMTDNELELAMLDKRWYAAIEESEPRAFQDPSQLPSWDSQDASSQASNNPSQERT